MAADFLEAAMLNWNTISDHNDYNDQRFELLKLLEGSTTKPYVDAVGDPTIGIGFNLVYNLEPVLRAIVGDQNWSDTLFDLLQDVVDKTYVPGQGGGLVSALNTVMKTWHDTIDSDVPATFAFKNDAQIAQALDAMDDYYDGRIDSWVAGIPDSYERAALFSLCWNAPSMLGPKLQAAIENGDRAEAWYEIRYNSLTSSLPDSVKEGIANRRYVEADMFSLFHNDAKATLAEAIDAGRMLASHHDTLLAYEAAYDPLTAALVKGVDTIGTISSELQPAIATVLDKYHLTVDHAIDELLATATGMPDLNGDGTNHDSAANDDDLLLGDKVKNVLSGGDGSDVLIGLKGLDKLIGGGGADLFVFTAAKDSSVTGRGDVIVDFSDGDQLSFAGKLDFHLLAEKNAAFDGMQAEIRWLWSNGKTVVEADYDGDGQADLHVTLSGKHSLSAGDFIL
jgi:GH24 family phage-related lysozyme (muramidase)